MRAQLSRKLPDKGSAKMEFLGTSIIGFRDGNAGSVGNGTFQAFAPATGQKIEPSFHSATGEEVDLAVRLAAEASTEFGRLSGVKKAEFLETIASRIEAQTESLVTRAHQESALPIARMQSETGRTCAQIRMFARVVREGSWVTARIDHSDPQRKPVAKPDVRSMLRPLGPVVVFGASNFPLAFSVAGGDTASAFAAGNPVIVKAHPAHPGTSELVGRIIRDSVRACDLPEGVFSLLFDSGTSVGAALVQHPLVRAVGFTGSIAAGRALFDLATKRPSPIPFYGEMGSTNPTFILPGALAARGEKIAAELYGSFTLGAGQFCTKPGLVFLSEGKPSEALVNALAGKVAESSKFTLLTAGISGSYNREIRNRKNHEGVALLAEEKSPDAASSFQAGATLFQTDITSFLASPDLASEVFGPETLLINYSKKDQILEAARGLHGHLTATVHGTEQDVVEFSELVAILENKVGRIIYNGYPTGLELCDATVHGGPYPASTDSRSTSVGTLAIFRFARPVCYQDFPDVALPDELKNENSLGIWRMVDGELTR
jgi:2,5-dioxopentanoate dehydrogenase